MGSIIKNNIQIQFIAKKNNFNNINFMYEEVLSQDLFPFYEKISENFMDSRFRQIVVWEEKIESERLFLYEIPLYEIFVNAVLPIKEQELDFLYFLENQILKFLELKQHFDLYKQWIEQHVAVIKRHYTTNIYYKITKYLHRVKIRFLRSLVMSKTQKTWKGSTTLKFV